MKKLQHIVLGAILTSVATAQNLELKSKELTIDKDGTPHIGMVFEATDSETGKQLDPKKIKVTAHSIDSSGSKTINGKNIEFNAEVTDAKTGKKLDPKDFKMITKVTENTRERSSSMNSKATLPEVYMGVSTAKISNTLSAQLDIPAGLGLSVINTVDKKSPAGKSEIQKHDILYKLNDQLLINKDQLMSLLGTFKIGETVKLSYFRKGQLAVSEITLEKRKAWQANHPNPDGLSVNIESFNPNGDNMGSYVGKIVKDFKMKDGNFKFDFNSLDGVEAEGKMITDLKMIVGYKDDNGYYTMKQTKEGLHFNAKDSDDKVLFDGLVERKAIEPESAKPNSAEPEVIQPEAPLKKVPAELLPQVRKMKKLLRLKNLK